MKKTLVLLYLVMILIECVSAENVFNKTPYDSEITTSIKEGTVLQLSCDITSKPAKAGQMVKYPVTIKNLSDELQTVKLAFKLDGWAIMPISVTPAMLELAPKESKRCTVKMTVVDKLPKGGQERRILIATPNDPYKTDEIELVTVRLLPHPNMLVDPDMIVRMKEKIKNFDWAKKNFEVLKQKADRWDSPKAKKISITREGITWAGLFPNYSTEHAWEVAIIWQLTGEEVYRDKLLAFIKAIADPKTGYVTTRWATDSDAFVHEGEFFCFFAALYDVFYDDPALSELDHENIQKAMRLYLKTCKPWHLKGDIGNWVGSANVGAICCAAMLQDISEIEYFLNCPRGFKEQLSLGLMGDGWWFEGASNYSYLTARIYSYAAKCVEAFGSNMFDMYLPVRYMGDSGRRWKNGWMSMNFDIWGPPGKSYRCLKDLYDGATILMDENGYVAANNDSDPKKPGDVFELGYYHYRDPAFLWSIDRDDRMSWQSLVYGIGEVKPSGDPRSMSGHVDNVGIAALRSQKEGQKPDEQIQAFLKWGTHGGWHGHFDRISLMQLRRYGKNLLLPLHKSSWFGYADKSYKAWIQPSISHNMVIVDQYQQEPVESELLMFYSGDSIQAAAVETNARWAQKLPWDINDPGDLDATNMKKMVDYGDAEPVLQRRLMVVTDDYILMFDYLAGQKEHTFDWLIHPVGFVKTEASEIEETKHTERMSDDLQSSYNYITDCQWFQTRGKVLNQFKDGNVYLNIFTDLQDDTEMAIGACPRKNPAPDALSRKTLMFRTQGREFRFASLLEPYLDKPLVKEFSVNEQGIAVVHMTDGRVQRIEAEGFETADRKPKVIFKEYRGDKLLRQEETIVD